MRARLSLVAAAFALSGCLGQEPHEPQPPKHHAYSDQEGPDPYDHPERTTNAPKGPFTNGDDARSSIDGNLPRSSDPEHPNVKVSLKVVDVISWDDVKVRGVLHGKMLYGVVSLTGWLKAGKTKGSNKSSTEQFIVVQAGREGSFSISDPLWRDLIGPYEALQVSVLEASAKGEVTVALANVTTTTGGQATLATRVKVASGEGVVVGGFRSEQESEGPGRDSQKKRDQLAILTATILR
ncbi:hypothetical protein HY251_05210 [bacterium]|nr:hypothetical protein [bacterium]